MTTRNMNKGRVYGWPVIDPGGLEGFFMVEHEAGPIWRYYALNRANIWPAPTEWSGVNVSA
jgi:hypothetical protein